MMVSPWLAVALMATVAASVDSSAPSPLAKSSRKERFLLSVLNFHNAFCVETATDGRGVEGVCQHRAECKYNRGVSMGTCAIFGACCTFERSCNAGTSLKVAYFVSPPLGSDQSSCTFRLDVANRDVCQIRLDFETFSLAQPTKADPTSFNPYECRTDAFIVGVNNLPALCGENSGQHMYVPINNTRGGNTIALTMMLASRAANPGLLLPRWRIKITQIECTGKTADFGSASNLFTTSNTGYLSVWNKQLPGINNDLALRAPPGCLQYYTERTGSYETFNYRDGRGPYLGNLNYAICFRRDADVCGIRHTPVTFSLAFNSNANGYTDDDCVATEGVDMPNQDYLYVPEGFTSANQLVASKYCGVAANSTNFITSVAPGPLYVFFRSDNINAPEPPPSVELGFRMNYNVLTSGC